MKATQLCCWIRGITSCKASVQGSKAAVKHSQRSLMVRLKSSFPESSIWCTRSSEFTHTFSFISLTFNFISLPKCTTLRICTEKQDLGFLPGGFVHAGTIWWEQFFQPEAEICSQILVPLPQLDAGKHGTNRTFFPTWQAQRVSKLTHTHRKKIKKSSSAALYHEKWLMCPAHWQTAWLPAVVWLLTLLKAEVCQWTQCHRSCRKQCLPLDEPEKPRSGPRRHTQSWGRDLGSWALFTVDSNDLASWKSAGKLNPGFCLEAEKFKGL